jgi:hypothetical protein
MWLVDTFHESGYPHSGPQTRHPMINPWPIGQSTLLSFARAKRQSLFRTLFRSPRTCYFPIRSFPHRRAIHDLIYGHFLGVLSMRRKLRISDKTSTRIPIWRRCLVFRPRPQDGCAPIRCHPHSIQFDMARFTADVIKASACRMKAMALNSFLSDFIYEKGIRASESWLRSPD